MVNGAIDVLRGGASERRAATRARARHEHGELGADEMKDARCPVGPAGRRWSSATTPGCHIEEIATVLGVRPGTVKSMPHRALAVLREEIER